MAWPNKNKDMIYRRVGNSGLHVSAISLGGWLTYGGHVGDETAFDCMKAAYDHGVNFFDTAENYSAGKAEVVMGQAIKKFGWSRSDLVISTKINYGAVNGEILVNNHGLSRKHIIEGLTASLKRMQLDYVDIVYAHRPDRLTPMEETVRAFNYVIEKGMAFYWGTSMWSADEISEACGIARSLGLIAPVVEQPLYNIIDRAKVEGEYQRLYSRCGIGLTVFSPMKQGLLTGKYNEAPEPPPGSRIAESQDGYIVQSRKNYGSEDWKKTIGKVAKLKPIAEKLGFKQSQLAIAWCLKNENVSSIIMGASKPEQVGDNVKSLELLPKLTPEVMAEIDEVMGNKPALDPARQG